MYWRFAWGLRRFLKTPLTLEQSHQILKQRLEERERNLLTVVRSSIYENPDSPYLKLLMLAGCEFGDFERMVGSDGVEGALAKLRREGVYVSIEEFKGKKEARRGSKTFSFNEVDFDNPCLAGQLETISGGSRSAGTRTIYDFEFLENKYTVHHLVGYDAYGLLDLPFAVWLPIVGIGPAVVLTSTKGGRPPEKWFSPVDKKGFRPSLKNRMVANYIVEMGRVFGTNMPRPEYVQLHDASVISHWAAAASQRHGGCSVRTYTSAAVRVCQVAKERGLDLRGTTFMVGGEPLTETKRNEIESSGARAYSSYGMAESGVIGTGCINPESADDVHFYRDSFGLVQHSREVAHAGVSVDALLLTTLLPSAPKVLFNVETGDYGSLERRNCGCKMQEIGFPDHISDIRGFDKLTGEGMTFVGTELLRIIEQVLPATYGGSSNDYQILEEEDEQGQTHMSIVVAPEVGEIHEGDIVRTVLDELGKKQDTKRMMTNIWSQAGTLRVKRIQPYATPRGKMLPLHILKRK